MTTTDLSLPIIKDGKDEIFPLVFTPETIEKFWQQARQFPTIFGFEIANDIDKFIDLFFDRHGITLVPHGLFWVMNPEQFTGIFYIDNIVSYGDEMVDCHAHYAFFNKRHHGRVRIVRKMLKFFFDKYKFQRVSAEIPNFVTPQARHFAMECGFVYEGKKRKAMRYKGEWFDVNLYSILRTEVLNGSE